MFGYTAYPLDLEPFKTFLHSQIETYHACVVGKDAPHSKHVI
jgi:hypothetical protein